MTAIAAVLAFSSTPLLAQETEPVADTRSNRSRRIRWRRCPRQRRSHYDRNGHVRPPTQPAPPPRQRAPGPRRPPPGRLVRRSVRQAGAPAPLRLPPQRGRRSSGRIRRSRRWRTRCRWPNRWRRRRPKLRPWKRRSSRISGRWRAEPPSGCWASAASRWRCAAASAARKRSGWKRPSGHIIEALRPSRECAARAGHSSAHPPGADARPGSGAGGGSSRRRGDQASPTASTFRASALMSRPPIAGRPRTIHRCRSRTA